jgi:hypothetical protein
MKGGRKPVAKDGPNKLTELDTVEVSLVDRGANRKRFALRKQETSMKMTMTKAQRAELAKAISGKTIAQIAKDLSAVNPEGRKALMAAIGLLANARANLPDGLLQEIMTAAGLESPADMIDLIAGDSAADESDGDMPGEADADDFDGMSEDDGADDADAEGEVEDASNFADGNTILSEADSTPDATKPNPGDKKPMKPTPNAPTKSLKLDPVAKAALAKADAARVELQKNLDAEKAARVELEKGLKIERDARVLKEFIAKAEKLPHLKPVIKADELGAMMKEIHEASPAVAEKLEKMLDGLNTQAKAVETLLKEHGHERPGSQPSTAMEMLKAKTAEIRKEFPKLTEAAAFDKALRMNPELYDQYNAEKEGAEA